MTEGIWEGTGRKEKMVRCARYVALGDITDNVQSLIRDRNNVITAVEAKLDDETPQERLAVCVWLGRAKTYQSHEV